MERRIVALVMIAFLTTPLSGSIAASSYVADPFETNLGESQILQAGQTTYAPHQEEIWWDPESKWWEVTSLDKDRNRIHDSIQEAEGIVNVGVSFSREIYDSDRKSLHSMGFEIRQELPVVNAILLGGIDAVDAWTDRARFIDEPAVNDCARAATPRAAAEPGAGPTLPGP